jgi:uncharacterized protein (UPF0335 family)
MSTENVSANQLKLFLERIETLEEERKGIADDIRDVYSEAKAIGFDTRTMKKLVDLRRMDPMARQEADALLETYRAAIGLDGGGGDDPAEDPKLLGARAHMLETLIRVRQGSVIQLKAAMTDKAAKALTYAQLTAQLKELVATGLATATPGANGLDIYASVGAA